MFKKLLITEFDANKNFLLASLAINVFFLIAMAYRDVQVSGFMGVTIVGFWVLLIVAAVTAGHEKRNRLYAQLPVSAIQAFSAGWFFALSWLSLQVLAWIVYGALFDAEFTATLAAQIVTFGLGAATFLLIVSIGIDLGAFRPAYIQWMYIFFMLGLLLAAIHFDMSIGIIGNDDGFHFYPIALMENPQLEMIISLLLVLALLMVDILIYRYRDSYLD